MQACNFVSQIILTKHLDWLAHYCKWNIFNDIEKDLDAYTYVYTETKVWTIANSRPIWGEKIVIISPEGL